MRILFCAALVFTVGRCTDDQSFVKKHVCLGQNVNLVCNRRSNLGGQLFWIRLVAGKFPEVLGATYTFDNGKVFVASGVAARQEPGAFVLHITKVELSDVAFYYCQQVVELQSTFLNKTFLEVKGPESDITAVPPSVLVHPGDSVTLQCSIFSHSESKTCPVGHSVHWFRAGSDEPHLSLIDTHGDRGDEYEKSPEVQSLHKCVYNLSKTISSSDSGTYYCAVATCGEILIGNGTKVDTKAGSYQRDNTFLFLLCASHAISLSVIASLIYIIKKNKCTCCKGAAAMQTATTGVQRSQQVDEDSLLYSVPDFTRKKAGRSGRRCANAVVGEIIYSDIRV